MVGCIPEPTIKEEVEHNQAPKAQTLKDSIESFDPKLVDLSFADSLLDFDSIKEFFELSPDKIGLENKIGFGRFDKVMEVEGEKGTPLNDPVVVGRSWSEVVEKVEKEGEGFKGGGDLGCSVEEEKVVEVDDDKRIQFQDPFVVGPAGSEVVEKLEKEGGGFEGGGNLGCCSIVEEMGRVNLNCELNLLVSSVVPEVNNVKSEAVGGKAEISNHCLVDGSSSGVGSGTGLSGELKRDGDGSDSDLESETETSSISSSSSSSSSSSDDEVASEESDQEEEKVVRVVEKERTDDGEIEEGEIRDDGVEEMFGGAGTEDEDEDGMVGSIQSKNEQVLPPVPPVDVTLQPHHQMEPVGVVSSVIGSQVIVEGVEKHNPLSEGSILWITDRRSPLGLIDEIFGPVKNPFYIVRYNSDSDVPAGIHGGTFVSFVPEFANHVLNEKALYEKGCDASDKEDNELLDEAEFSDDEKEAEYKRMLKISKRGMNEQIVGNNKKDRKKVRNRDWNLKNGKPFGPQTPAGQLPLDQDQHDISSLGPSISHGSSSSASRQDFIGGTGFVPPFAQMGQTTATFPPSNGVWANGIPLRPSQSAMFPGGFQINNIDGNSKTAGPSGPQASVTGGSSFSPAPGQGFTGGTGYVPPFPQMGQTTGVFQPSSGLWANGVPSQQPHSARTPGGGFQVDDIPWPALNQLQQPSLLALLNAIQLQQQFNASQGLHPNSILPGGQPNPFAGLPYPAWQGVAGQNCFDQTTFGIGCQGQPTHPTMNPLNAGDQGVMPNAQGQQNPNSQQPAAIHGHFQATQDRFNAGSFSGRGRKPRRRGGRRDAGGRGRHK